MISATRSLSPQADFLKVERVVPELYPLIEKVACAWMQYADDRAKTFPDLSPEQEQYKASFLISKQTCLILQDPQGEESVFLFREPNGKIAGIMSLEILRGVMTIVTLVKNPTLIPHRSKVGKTMIAAAKAMGVRENLNTIFVSTLPGSEAFYTKMGFVSTIIDSVFEYRLSSLS